MSQDLLEERKHYAKTLKRCGYVGGRRKPLVIEKPNNLMYSREVYPSLDTGHHAGVRVEDTKYKEEVSSMYVIGQAYNKSGVQVLSRIETNDPTTGKRR